MAFLQVVHAGGLPLLKYLCNEFSIPYFDSFFQVHTQKEIGKTNGYDRRVTADGLLTIPSFKLVVESKIAENNIDIKQLKNYEILVDGGKLGDNSAILYLTPDKEMPECFMDCVANWCSWDNMFDILDSYPEEDSHLRSLVTGLKGLWESIRYGREAIPADRRVAVLAGNYAYPVAVREGIYHCQKGRRFGGAKYFAFYANRRIEKVFEVTKGPVDYDPARWRHHPVEDDYYELKEVPGIIPSPIVNHEIDKRGRTIPFTQGQPRYVDIDTLKQAKDITELKQLNKLK